MKGAALGAAALAAGVLAAPAAGVAQLGEPEAERSVRGIDVSHHQGAIDWRQVAGSGIRFAFLKATEGRDHRDPRFASHWQAAAAAGIERGAYHFFTFCSPGREQAAHFLRVAPPTPGALAPVADVEFVGNCRSFGSLERVRVELRAFLEVVEEAWGRAPILYVTPDSYERITAGAFDRHPVWIRSVRSEPPKEAYGGWLLWQYSETGRVPGIRGAVDLDVLSPGLTLGELRLPAPRGRGARPRRTRRRAAPGTPGWRQPETRASSRRRTMADLASTRRALLLGLEWPRAFAEAATLPGFLPLLRRLPRGDGHPVLVLPGYLAGDGSTRVLRAFLRQLGYRAHRWGLGVNLGLADGVGGRLHARLEALHARHGRRLSLVGWSLGGVQARELAKLAPGRVRQVVTLGSPFAAREPDGGWLHFMVYGEGGRGARAARALASPPPVPSTAIVSRSDGIAGFRRCREQAGARAENVEVVGSHIGLGLNPLVLYAIADRLAQPEGGWRPFARSGWRRALYG